MKFQRAVVFKLLVMYSSPWVRAVKHKVIFGMVKNGPKHFIGGGYQTVYANYLEGYILGEKSEKS